MFCHGNRKKLASIGGNTMQTSQKSMMLQKIGRDRDKYVTHVLTRMCHSKPDFIETENTVVVVRERLAKWVPKYHWIGAIC